MTGPVYSTLFIAMAVAIVCTVWIVARQFTASRATRAELTSGKEYRGLAEEYRRLSDLAITAQEHTDLRLTDIGVRLDELRDQFDQMQRILKEVE